MVCLLFLYSVPCGRHSETPCLLRHKSTTDIYEHSMKQSFLLSSNCGLIITVVLFIDFGSHLMLRCVIM